MRKDTHKIAMDQGITLQILVMLPNNLGDVIMATPVIEGVAKKHPGSEITYFCESGFEAGMMNNPFCKEIYSFPRKSVRNAILENFANGKNIFKRAIADISARQWDVIINLSQHPYMAMVASLLKSKSIVGQKFLFEGNLGVFDEWTRYLFAIPFSRHCNNLHAVDVYRRIAGVKTHRGGYSVAIAKSEKDWARNMFDEIGFASHDKIMVFQPGAAFPSKRWPYEYFVALGTMLARDDWKILVCGAAIEMDIAEKISAQIGSRSYCVAGKTTFRQSMALASLCNGCVTGDTAQMHACAGMDVPTYALFGPTNPVETGPYGNGNFVFSGRCGSMPCFKTECGSTECMKSILPEDVYACIKANACALSCSCNVYKTSLSPNGDYSCVPQRASMHRYFHEGAVCVIRNIFDDRWNCVPDSTDFAHNVAEMGKWLEIVSDMCNALIKFDKTKDPKFVTMFEVMKNSLAGLTSVGAFCTAVLNLRLNSVPMLTPLEAVRLSLEECWSMHKLVGKAIV